MRQTFARLWVGALLAICGASATFARDVNSYPDGPIRIMVGFVPGGPTDLYARIAARAISDALGQQVVVENRPGGSGAIAAKAVAAAEPDGYTLLVNVVSDIITPILNKKAGYNLQTNFVPVGLIASSPNVLVAGPGTPVASVQDLVALAKKSPGALTYGSAGTATVSHLAGVLLAAETGVSMTHVPYKGTAGAQVDLLAGRVSIMFDNLTNGLANAKAGRVRALAVTSAQRWPGAPELPTMAEAGYPGVTIISSFGMVAPAGTPAPIIARLAAALQKALQDEKVRRAITDSGSEPGNQGPKEYGNAIAEESRRWARFLEQNPGIAASE